MHSLMNRKRRLPPNRGSAPDSKRMGYRESNASRLRQDVIKGMTPAAVVRNARSISSRSNSAESGSPSPRINVSRNTTPGCTPRSTSRQPSIERSKDQSCDRRIINSAKAKKDVDKLPDISGSPPISASVNSCKVPSNSPSVLACLDTRSKTVNSVNPGRPPTADEVLDTMNNIKPRITRARAGACKSTEPKGYGKPLVTPLNKKLTIRRDQPWPYSSQGAEKVMSPNCGTKSPNRKNKAENRESPSQNASLQRAKLINTKIPTKVTVSGNRLRESNTNPNVFPDTKIPILRANLGAKSLRPSSSSLQGRRSLSRSPPRHTSNKNQDYSNTSTYKSSENHGLPEIKHWTADRNKTPPRSPNRGRSPMRDRVAAAEAKRKSPPSNIDETSNKETTAPLTRPYPPAHINRSFKPQLEDIKSSYLLLNKLSQESAKTVTRAGRDTFKVSHVVNQFNEERRRHKLTECKKKFQSSRFFEESRFDKIEGLNWITWK